MGEQRTLAAMAGQKVTTNEHSISISTKYRTHVYKTTQDEHHMLCEADEIPASKASWVNDTVKKNAKMN